MRDVQTVKIDCFHQFWVCAALTLATVAVFWQVCTYDFINCDDPLYVYENPNIQAGITLKTIKWAFTTGYANFWHPLTWLSHMLDWQLFGSNPAGHHLVNLIFHIANTLLVFLVLKRMTGALWSSAFVAALFALHPLHVESVAWASERKDVLSTLFWMLTMWAYVRFANHPKITSYLMVVVLFALGLMSKPMLVTLPFVLLLLDYWPLDRLSPKRGKAGSKYSLSYLLIEKVPLFAMVLASCIVTFIIQKKGGAIHTGENYTFLIRLANASISYLQYITKMIWPARLAVPYPHPGQNVSILYAIISAALLLSVTILILRFAANRRYLVTGWFWYLGTLVPVIGLIQVGEHAMADRYSYITLTGLFIIIAWGLPDLLAKWRYKKIALTLSALLIILAMTICTHLQLRHWRSSLTLFQHALDVTKDNYGAHSCMAESLYKQNRLDESIYHYSEALRINPDNIEAIINLGLALSIAGRIDEAIYYYERALKIDPSSAQAHTNLGLALATKGKFAEAIRHSTEALRIKPDSTEALTALGIALHKAGRIDEAISYYKRTLELNPHALLVYLNLGAALTAKGKFTEAVSLYNKALQIAPDLIDVHLNLGFALSSSGKLEEAVKEYEKILLIQPRSAVAHNDLAVVFLQQGKLDEAIEHFSQAVRIDPNYTTARDNLNLALTEKQKSPNTENTRK
jgi:tetratricopeptide (TPR) repeat protein